MIPIRAELGRLRWVAGADASGTVHIEAEERIGIEDPGYRPRFQCGECLAQFPILRRLTLELLLRPVACTLRRPGEARRGLPPRQGEDGGLLQQRGPTAGSAPDRENVNGLTGRIYLEVDVVPSPRHQDAPQPGTLRRWPAHASARRLDHEPERPLKLVEEERCGAGAVLRPPLRLPIGLLLRTPTDAQDHGSLEAGQ